jgi:hypothetical protein
MVDPEKTKALVAELRQKTETRKITWEPTAAQDEFVATFRGRVTFTVRKFEDPDVYGDSYKLVMRDSEGREMFSFTSRTVGMDVDLHGLYEIAHDSALKVDETIDTILENLREAH